MTRIFHVIVIVGLLIHSNPSLSEGGRPTGSLRGFSGIDAHLNHRFFEVSKYPIPNYFVSYQLNGLMGAYENSAGSSTFANARPNGINIHLWDKVMSNFSKSIGGICAGDKTSSAGIGRYTESALNAVLPLCEDADKITDDHLEGFWILVMGYRAPQSEYGTWKEYIRGAGSSILQEQAELRVTLLLKMILMNPYFLLEH